MEKSLQKEDLIQKMILVIKQKKNKETSQYSTIFVSEVLKFITRSGRSKFTTASYLELDDAKLRS